MFNFFVLFISVFGLIWSSNHLVAGAVGIAHYYRMSTLFVGLTLIAIGTSIPTIAFAIFEAFTYQKHDMISQVIGSNIANIGLVLGLTILLCPPKIHSALFKHGYPLFFLIMLLTYTLMLNEYLSVTDGCILLLGNIILICYLAYLAKQSIHIAHHQSFRTAIFSKRSMKLNLMSLLMGFIIIAASSFYLTNSLVHIAQHWHLSENMIQSTIIAMGPTLPILSTCIIAALKDQDQLAVGTILGSNMFNLLGVLAFPGIISPSVLSPHIVWRDMPILLALTFIIFLINYHSKRKMIRWHGGLLLLIYGCYIVSLIYSVNGSI